MSVGDESSSSQLANTNWTDILLEIRALLHEPLRYHPNIVRLLSLGWSSSDSGSIFPTLIMEYADYGSLSDLQKKTPPLPFRVKQKLMYDVSRGLSVIHACGIVHGDLKHENVLVFKNRYNIPDGQPYTAKLADFGGAVMDISYKEHHALRMGTFPFEAPEAAQQTDVEGIKKTDIYSFGMLAWRCYVDADDILSGISSTVPTGSTLQQVVYQLKTNDQFIGKALEHIAAYKNMRDISQESLEMMIYVLIFTIRAKPVDRHFVKAQLRLRGESVQGVEKCLPALAQMTARIEDQDRNKVPGRHGMNLDSVGYELGKTYGDDYDPQNNLPGSRPKLSQPEAVGFHFDPIRLKRILDWDQQAMVLADFERIASQTATSTAQASMEPPWWMAAFFLFQCYLTEFGTRFDPSKACHWLYRASKYDNTCDVNYWAQAWLWRIHLAFSVPLNITGAELSDALKMGLFRGHRNCKEDMEDILDRLPEGSSRELWRQTVTSTDHYFKLATGGAGVLYWQTPNLRRIWDIDLNNLADLDNVIKQELGDKYESSLRKEDVESQVDKEKPFDMIYVNHKGYGVLHYAAMMANVSTLRHLLEKYDCNINLANQAFSETPLVSAVRAGLYNNTLFFIERGANPNGDEYGNEAPLHWLCNLEPDHMPEMAKKLVDAGADIEMQSGGMRKDVRKIYADWEDMFGVPVTPLGRAVIMRSMPAVKILLDLGADPFCVLTKKNVATQAAVQLAAVLTLPHFLRVLLDRTDLENQEVKPLFDECSMLAAAHACEITPNDTTTLQSRLVRCGLNYKTAMKETLRMLHDRCERGKGKAIKVENAAKQLCDEIRRGNSDIVESLLELGHDMNGTTEHIPLEAAISVNHEGIFFMLVGRGAIVNRTKLVPGWGEMSLLQLFASRPRNSPSGVAIAEYLIENGIPLEAQTHKSPSPFVLAIKNQYFDLADLLIAKGADVNSVYPLYPGATNGRCTVLKDLLQQRTFSSLESVSHLLSEHVKSLLNKRSSSDQRAISFIVDPQNELSALHILATTPKDDDSTVHKSQITLSVIAAVLDYFDAPNEVNFEHAHIGTALCAACIFGNTQVVESLIEHGADITICAKPSMQIPEALRGDIHLPEWYSLTKIADGSPASVVLAGLTDLIASLTDGRAVTTEVLTAFNRIQRIAEAVGLIKDSKFLALQEQRERLVSKSLLSDQLSQLQLYDAEAEKPINLGVLTEEKPVGWTEGMEMTHEMSLRTFLKYFRTG
jgi:serine/threonine protein kinase/ankyrin repeat protein